jgi:hypothetical protein
MTPNDRPDFDSPTPTGDPREVVSEHAIHRDGIITRFQTPIFFFIILLILGTVFILMGIYRSEPLLSVIGAVVAVGGVALLVYVLRNMYRGVRRLTLTGSGLQWEDDQSAHERKWEDVLEVYTRDVISRADRDTNLRVVFADGSTITLDNRLKKYETLTRSLLLLASQALLPVKKQEVATGGARFGPVVLHADGLQLNEHRKRWDELEQWTINNGYLYIINTDPKDRYGWEVSLFDVPNYQVLFGLLEEVWQGPTLPERSIPFGDGRRKSAAQ